MTIIEQILEVKKNVNGLDMVSYTDDQLLERAAKSIKELERREKLTFVLAKNKLIDSIYAFIEQKGYCDVLDFYETYKGPIKRDYKITEMAFLQYLIDENLLRELNFEIPGCTGTLLFKPETKLGDQCSPCPYSTR